METFGPIGAITKFLRQAPGNTLHHYTTSAGLIGIFESQTIWATSLMHLNDSEEYVHALKLLRLQLEKRIVQESGAKKRMFGEWLDEINVKEKPDAFVTSFSESPDLLSQWRAYSESGSGYSIGFSPAELKEIAQGADCLLVKCVYTPGEQGTLISQLAENLFRRMERAKSLAAWRGMGWIGRTNVMMLSVLAAMKHPSFAEEREWRLVKWADSRKDIRFRSGRLGIVPYYQHPLPNDGQSKMRFSEVIIGPTQDKTAAAFAVDCLINRYAVPWKTPFAKLTRHSESSWRG